MTSQLARFETLGELFGSYTLAMTNEHRAPNLIQLRTEIQRIWDEMSMIVVRAARFGLEKCLRLTKTIKDGDTPKHMR